MNKILFINACVRPESRTLVLAKKVLENVKGEIEEVNLEHASIAPLDCKSLQKRLEYTQANDFSAPMFQYARQFVAADEIVIAAPYWDMSFPATLKIYLEMVTVGGLSFCYNPEGRPTGLCNAKKITYVTTSGGIIAGNNFGYDYVKALATTCYGIPEVLCYTAEKLDIVGMDVNEIMANTISAIEKAMQS